MDIVKILSRRYDGEWVLRGDSYEGLEWLSDSPKPTKSALEKLWAEVQAEIAAEAQAKVDAKASTIAKLEALGLTVEEIKTVFGLE